MFIYFHKHYFSTFIFLKPSFRIFKAQVSHFNFWGNFVFLKKTKLGDLQKLVYKLEKKKKTLQVTYFQHLLKINGQGQHVKSTEIITNV